jgi:hypothetical protein
MRLSCLVLALFHALALTFLGFLSWIAASGASSPPQLAVALAGRRERSQGLA